MPSEEVRSTHNSLLRSADAGQHGLKRTPAPHIEGCFTVTRPIPLPSRLCCDYPFRPSPTLVMNGIFKMDERSKHNSLSHDAGRRSIQQT